MATSTLSSLGLGSDGVLSYDLLDQLREVDESAIITPIETKITKNQTKTSDLAILTTMAASLKSSASTLSDEITYLSRSTSTSGTSASVTVESGSAIQDFYIDVQNIATRDIYQSKSYSSSDSTFASGDDILTIQIGEESYDIEVTAETTLTELKDLITDATDGKVVASILNVGGDTPYKLVLKSSDTGADNTITFSSTGDTGSVVADLGLDTNTYQAGTPIGAYSGTDTLTFTINNIDYDITVEDGDTVTQIAQKIQDLSLGEILGASVDEDGNLVITSNDSNISVEGDSASTFGLDSLYQTSGNVQKAQNAKFLYNGVMIERDTNEIDDLIVGVSIKLQDTGKTTVDITQDTSSITSAVNSFISNYNSLMSNLEESIKYDATLEAAGTFQGVTEIVYFKTTLGRQLMSADSLGRTLEDYGISLNDSGLLEIDSEVFSAKLEDDPTSVEEFFRGYTEEDSEEEIDGYFTKLNSTLADYIDGDDSILGLYNTQLADELSRLEDQETKAVEKLDDKYEIMAKKWAAYDSMISQLNTQFSTLQSMIDAQYNNSDS